MIDITNKILILDGGLGTQIQNANLCPDDFHGHTGCNDYLCLSRPDIIGNIHKQYLEAGADIISTNSFNATGVSLSEYGLQDQVYQINLAAAQIAKQQASKYKALVAGSVGPTSRSLSLSPDVDRPAYRALTFEALAADYANQIRGLITGGVDLILAETFFDTLNAKAVVYALRTLLGQTDFPLMISGTVTDASGRTLSGQSVEAFYYSVRHAQPLTIGLNCAFGAEQLMPYIERLAKVATCGISAHPNAGLPNVMGGYDESPLQMAQVVENYMRGGLVNIIGGCCGTTPEYIAHLRQLREKYKPRQLSDMANDNLILSGLEPLIVDRGLNFVNIGERTNVAGSAKFARLIREGQFDQALEVAHEQVEGGAQIIDVCMDAPMIDAVVAMTEFLNLMAAEPDIARLPVMIDSSDWNVIQAGLKTQQGRAIVNSISLKEGEAIFLEHAAIIRSFGAAAVVMLFDERGQADSYQRKIDIADRAYKLLVGSGFAASDIVFDPNILAVATGIEQHNDYGRDFIEATRWIKANCPGARVSGGVSNLSFSFRGNNEVREAMHSVFLYHAIAAGMDMGIVNPSLLQIYDNIEPRLRELCEDVILNISPLASEHLLEYASNMQHADKKSVLHIDPLEGLSAQERVKEALKRGITQTIQADTMACYQHTGSALGVIDNVLMEAMAQIGELFGAGKMFLPQVVKSARVMKAAVAVLQPYITQDQTEGATAKQKQVLIATVKGDVHDIGKNIVALVLRCNNYHVTDLGVMVEPDTLVKAAREHNPDIVLLSGLITPSLEEMRRVAQYFDRAGLSHIPISVGGATTSALHTAVKIAPAYPGLVAHSTDASNCVNTVNAILQGGESFVEQYKEKQRTIRQKYSDRDVVIQPLKTARENARKSR